MNVYMGLYSRLVKHLQTRNHGSGKNLKEFIYFLTTQIRKKSGPRNVGRSFVGFFFKYFGREQLYKSQVVIDDSIIDNERNYNHPVINSIRVRTMTEKRCKIKDLIAMHQKKKNVKEG